MAEDDHGLDALAFAPHPDDAELCCGGTVARLVQLGYRVGIVDLTAGELASNGTPETRAAEAAAASEVLGLSLRENLALPDGHLEPNDEQLAAVVGAIRRIRPELVLAPFGEARHPDHRAAHDLVRRAVFFAGVRNYAGAGAESRPFTPRQVLYYQMRFAFRPDLVIDVSAAAELKARAIACYGSQLQRAPGAVATMANAPLSLGANEARDRYYGATIGREHAEPFATDAVIGLADPIAHFRANPFDALIFPERR